MRFSIGKYVCACVCLCVLNALYGQTTSPIIIFPLIVAIERSQFVNNFVYIVFLLSLSFLSIVLSPYLWVVLFK